MGLQYPWVETDLDAAAAALGGHVKAEFEKARRARDKELNPPRQPTKGKKERPRPHKSIPDHELDEIWQTVVARVVERKVLFFIDGDRDVGDDANEPCRWRIEKPVTGDRKIDEVANKGERETRDHKGRLRAAFDAEGTRTFFWKPG